MNFSPKLERTPEFKEVLAISALVAVLTTVMWLSSSLGQWSDRFSFDVLTVLLRKQPPADTIIIYMDERSHDALGQHYDRPWDRRLHAKLLRFLKQEGARLVYFDILFEQASLDPAADAEFADAIREHGAVIIGGSIAGAQEAEGTEQRIIAPLRILRQAVKGWGALSFFPIDRDSVVRRFPLTLQEVDHATWPAAKFLNSGSADAAVMKGMWVRYYGPPGSFSSVSYHQALQGGVPPGLFKGKIVLVGAKYTAGFSGSARDSFATPYSRFDSGWMTGTEVNANLLTTLRENSGWRKIPALLELALLILASGGVTWILLGLRPAAAGIAAFTAAVLPGVLAWMAAAYFHWWENWFLFSGLVIPSALVVSVGRNYYHERFQRQRVLRAFEKYLGPEMARQAALSKVDLKPGGTTRQITAMMTDIKGFSTVAEKMSPAELSVMLIAYFSELTRHIFDHKGTVLQFAGDGSYSVWGAPLDHPEPADQALRAALALQAAMRVGKLSETRVGISTGVGLCGNLGSADRFDYTVIGDNVNLASRLEGANKKLGTHVVLADSTRRELKQPWVLRELGDFLVAGRDTPVKVWEPIVEGAEPPPEWRATLDWFARGLTAWRVNDQTEATRCFKAASESRGEKGDAPSQFYLARIGASFRRAGEVVGGGAISLSKD